MNTNPDYLFISIKLLGALGLLIYGMKVMSEALQKMAGSQLRHILGKMTTNRFTGMLTGVLVTSAVQSSSATTVMTVSFVNAGLLTLAQAVSDKNELVFVVTPDGMNTVLKAAVQYPNTRFFNCSVGEPHASSSERPSCSSRL